MKCVLVLEDEPLIALDLKYACEDAGLECVIASTCEQAMDAVDRHSFCGAILDVNLGGGETCEAVARALREQGVPFLLNTGDLDRAGEFLREIDAPIMSKPGAADAVIARLISLAGASPRAVPQPAA